MDLPINSMVIFHSYVSLPEGRSVFWLWHVQLQAGTEADSAAVETSCGDPVGAPYLGTWSLGSWDDMDDIIGSDLEWPMDD